MKNEENKVVTKEQKENKVKLPKKITISKEERQKNIDINKKKISVWKATRK